MKFFTLTLAVIEVGAADEPDRIVPVVILCVPFRALNAKVPFAAVISPFRKISLPEDNVNVLLPDQLSGLLIVIS